MKRVPEDMPGYQCHKVVRALLIEAITVSNGEARLHFAEEGFPSHHVTQEWRDKHAPTPGDYFVVYNDGYESVSPPQAFEEGYRLFYADVQSPLSQEASTEGTQGGQS